MSVEYPDKTVDELRNADDSAKFSMSQEEYDDLQDEYQDMREAAILFMQSAALGEMFVENEITMQQYVEWVEWIEKRADEKGVDLP